MNKNWKIKFKELEEAKNWDSALEFLLKVIEENPDEKDAYIFMHYFFMNLFLEANYYDDSKYDYYTSTSIKYFKMAYEKYKNDAEYLFWASIPLCHGPWYFGIYSNNDDEYKKMAEKACLLDQNNILYKAHFFGSIIEALRFFQNELLFIVDNGYRQNYLINLIRKEKLELSIYMKEMSDENSKIRKEIASKGSLGEYFLQRRNFKLEEALQYKEL